jgi:hypothetical protein
MFRRRSSQQPAEGAGAELESSVDEPELDEAARSDQGPWDSEETPDDGLQRIDLGSLLVAPSEDTEVRLQIDEQSGEVQSVMLAGEEGALELRAFAAPRGGDLWTEVRPQIAADVARNGGTATEREGRWGSELVCQMQVILPDGTQAMQASRIVGINGPRWLLRATFLGKPAVELEGVDDWENALAGVVVHRGTHAMPVGDALPLQLPPEAQQVSPPPSS